jgi:uncharacterized membrane protein YbhN (UPF0104 family)
VSTPATKKRIHRLLRWAVAVLAMVFVVRELVSDPEPLRRLLQTRIETLLGFGLLVVVNQALMSARFSVAVAFCGGVGVPARVWFRLTSVGQMLNLFAPQLGNLYRGWALKREYGISYMSYASGLFAFVWLDLVMGFCIATLVILALDPGLRFGPVPALLLLSAVILALAVAPVAAARLVSLFRVAPGVLARIQTRAATLLSIARSVWKSHAFLLRYFLLSVLATIGQVAALALGFDSVGAKIGLSALLLFQVLLKVSNQLVITPGNLGITELLFGALAYGSQCTLEQGLAVALLLRAVGTVMVIVLGLLSGGGGLLLRGREAIEQAEDPTPPQPKV